MNNFFLYFLVVILIIWCLGYLFFKYLLPYLVKRFLRRNFGIDEKQNEKPEENNIQYNDTNEYINKEDIEYTEYEEIDENGK
ncbi:MAG: hypothetical protein LBV69_10965 [Bacteroidales bacterium]|nr:hypothetical protein [Bacteroidales bacterium]